jgi:hypothetical protein
MIIEDGSDVPGLCKQIVKICTKDGEIDQDDMDRRLGMLYADRCLSSVNYKPKPERPEVMRQFDMLSKDKKYLFEKENPDWRRLPTVQAYMDKSSSADAENHSNVYWLKFWMTKVDPARKEKLRQKLTEFEVHMPTHQRTYVPNPGPQPKEVQELLNTFGGEVVDDWRKDAKNRKPY